MTPVRYIEVGGCPVPTEGEFDLGVLYVVRRTGAEPTTVYRGDDPQAVKIMHAHGKHTQRELANATAAQRAEWGIRGTPNAPGTSTHELAAAGIFAASLTAHIPGWQCGQDWPIPEVGDVIETWDELHAGAFRPYPTSIFEGQHVCNRHQPRFTTEQRVLARPLVHGMHSPALRPVQILLKRGHYLSRTFDVADEIGTMGPVVVKGVKRFQHDHHLRVDGIVGVGTLHALQHAYGH